MQEQTQIGDKMKFDLDIGESEMLEVSVKNFLTWFIWSTKEGVANGDH